ncbi:D-xylose-proton symporter [Scenedesmus sp. PABB004]|nr:D-xylose-proton symporter [Scenedesmus sp. PABB004]
MHEHAAPRGSDAVDVDWLATGLCFIFPALGGLLFGYDIGASSGVLASLTSAELSGTSWGPGLSAFESGLVVSTSLFGALLGSLAALAGGNRVGRRTELLAAAGLFGVGAGGLGLAGGLAPLLACRLLYGLGIGAAMHAAPAYIAETSPPSVRGLLISLKEAIIVGGILAGYGAGYVFADAVGGWRSIYGCAAPLALLLGVGMASLPESPRWLLLSGAPRDDALRALVRAEGRRAADLSRAGAEVDAMAASLAEGAAGGGAAGGGLGLGLFAERRYSRPLLVGMSLMLFQQITGQPSVLYYATQIFAAAGFAAGQEAAGASVLLGGFKLLMTLVAVASVDRVGRRPLLLGGVGGMALALAALTAAQGGVDAAAGAAAGVGGAAWVSVAAMLLYVGCYQVSFGPISWLIVGEVFPLAVRSQAIAIATFVNFSANFLVSLALPSLQAGAGMTATYGLFCAIALLAWASIYANISCSERRGRCGLAVGARVGPALCGRAPGRGAMLGAALAGLSPWNVLAGALGGLLVLGRHAAALPRSPAAAAVRVLTRGRNRCRGAPRRGAQILVDSFHPVARWRLRHIPGPPPLPVCGNTLEVFQHGLFLFKAWEKWAETYGDVFKWFWGPQPVICVRDAELARLIMVRHFKSFPDRSMFYPPQDATVNRVFREGITFSKGAYWMGLRGALQPLFHSTGLRSYQPLVEAAVSELAGELSKSAAAGASVDMHAALANVALKSIGEAAFGVKLDTQEVVDGEIRENAIVAAATYALENTAVTLTFMLTPPLLKPLVWPLVQAFPPARLRQLNVCRMQLFTAALTLAQNALTRLGLPWRDEIGMAKRFDRPEVAALREKYRDVVPAEGSVVDLLVRAKNKETGQPLQMHHIVAQANSILVAGHDTTSFMLTSTLYHVASHPGVKARLQEEIERFGRTRPVTHADMDQFPYLDAVLQESLRLSPPGWMTTREAVEDITLNGLFIPRGSVVYIDIWGIQRSARYWPDPTAFRPERFLDKSPEALERNQLAWLAFGAGPRLCIGYKFALSEAKTVLVSLWQRFDFELDAARTPDPPPLRPGITLGFRHGLWCRVTPRAA